MGTINAREQAEAVVHGLSWRDWDDGTLRFTILNAYPNIMKWQARFKGTLHCQFEVFEAGQEVTIKRRLARQAARVLRRLNADE